MSTGTWILLALLGWVGLSCLLLLTWLGLVILGERRAYRRQLTADRAEHADELRFRSARRLRS